MKIVFVNAAERFDNTRFSNEVLGGMAASIYSVYTCPRCAAKISYQKANFEHERPPHYSNIAPEISARFDVFAKTNVGTKLDYVDWLCPQCGLAARVYYSRWAGGRHGDAGITLECVIESAGE
jgi:predicted RNA-binding Zn-ribbon protein involved in translation (DUF1610 family)